MLQSVAIHVPLRVPPAAFTPKTVQARSKTRLPNHLVVRVTKRSKGLEERIAAETAWEAGLKEFSEKVDSIIADLKQPISSDVSCIREASWSDTSAVQKPQRRQTASIGEASKSNMVVMDEGIKSDMIAMTKTLKRDIAAMREDMVAIRKAQNSLHIDITAIREAQRAPKNQYVTRPAATWQGGQFANPTTKIRTAVSRQAAQKPLRVQPQEPTDDVDVIKRAYRRLSLKHHPDKGGSEETFAALTKAYCYLLRKLDKLKYKPAQPHELKQQVAECMKQQPATENRFVDRTKFDLDNFNNVFNEHRLEDPNDDGYGELMTKTSRLQEKDSPDIPKVFDSNFNPKKFNSVFEEHKASDENKQLVIHEEPEALVSGNLGFYELGADRVEDFGSISYVGGKYQQLQDQRELLEKGINDQREIFEAKLEAARASAIQQCNEKFLQYGYAAEYKALQQRTLGERAPKDIRLSLDFWFSFGLKRSTKVIAVELRTADFVESIQQLTSRGLGQWAGSIVGSLFGLNQSTSNASLNISNFFLFSFAEYHSYYFVGVFGMWVPLDPKLFVFWLVAHSTWAWRIAQQFLGRDFGSMQWVQQNLSNPGWLWQAAQRFLQQQL
ncbi:hypothetical protein WJX77_005441 [Trebouxia sp. C0004]